MWGANKRIINEIPLVLITFGKFTSGKYGVNQYFTVARDLLPSRIGANNINGKSFNFRQF